ncbi:MAG: glycosyl transferase group 1 [Candidatus Eremiobacteraeota bacterium]|nr:glycosyl transferase group 1 [Candidatus Eremiobacteraeota bacterium]
MVGLHLRWRGVWQRPNHLLTRFARDVRVIVVEEPLAGGRDNDDIAECDGVTVITPRRVARPDDALDDRSIGTVRGLVGERPTLVWLYTPMMLALADAFPHALLAYDKMDELAKFVHADPRIGPREEQLLERAAIVFSGGRSLFRSVERRTRNAHCYPSGVDVDHFERARTSETHPALAPYNGKPVFGYVGVIDERIDLELVDALAAARPDAIVAMVGPVVKIDEATLPRRANIVYLGQRGYAELPQLLAGFDVALMPFALNEHTDNISPTKTLEYLAAGLPVVSTAVPDVVADHAGVVYVARDRAEFVALTATAGRADDERALLAGEKVRAASWDAIAAAMRSDLAATGVVLAPADLRPGFAAR